MSIAGSNSFIWLGPYPAVIILDSESIREIMVKYNLFQKPHFHPLGKYLIQGLVASEGKKWAKHRKIINPAFHLEKLKVLLNVSLSTAKSSVLIHWR